VFPGRQLFLEVPRKALRCLAQLFRADTLSIAERANQPLGILNGAQRVVLLSHTLSWCSPRR
jgi:hypothetical protein